MSVWNMNQYEYGLNKKKTCLRVEKTRSWGILSILLIRDDLAANRK